MAMKQKGYGSRKRSPMTVMSGHKKKASKRKTTVKTVASKARSY